MNGPRIAVTQAEWDENAEFRRVLSEWHSRAANLLRSQTVYSKRVWRDEPPPFHADQVTQVQLPANERVSARIVTQVMVPDIGFTIGQHARQLKQLPGIDALINIVQRNHSMAEAYLSESPAFDSQTDRLFHQLLFPLLRESWRRSGNLVPELDGQLLDLIEQAAFAPGEVIARWRVLFWNFRWEGETIRLTEPDANIRLATPDEFNEVRDYGTNEIHFYTGHVPGEYTLGGILEIRREVREFSGTDVHEASIYGQRLAKSALLGLRLLEPEWVSIESIILDLENPFARNSLGGGRSSGYDESVFGIRGPVYALKGETADRLAQLWPLLQIASDDQELHVPISRFTDSYRRPESYDRHLDYWVALESMLVPAGTSEDLVRVIRATLPLYLYPTQSARHAIRPYVLDSYDLRSKLIHGDAIVFPWNGNASHVSSRSQKSPPVKSRDELIDMTKLWVQKALLKRIYELAN